MPGTSNRKLYLIFIITLLFCNLNTEINLSKVTKFEVNQAQLKFKHGESHSHVQVFEHRQYSFTMCHKLGSHLHVHYGFNPLDKPIQ